MIAVNDSKNNFKALQRQMKKKVDPNFFYEKLFHGRQVTNIQIYTNFTDSPTS